MDDINMDQSIWDSGFHDMENNYEIPNNVFSSLIEFVIDEMEINEAELQNDDDPCGGGNSVFPVEQRVVGDIPAAGAGLKIIEPPVVTTDSLSVIYQTAEDIPAAAEENRKRKARADDDSESQNNPYEIAEAKKKKAATAHSLCERRRRDKNNEKLMAVRDIIPNCYKTDKASILDDAVKYMKTLQLQLQHMINIMGYGVPMMYNGMQQYMPGMGMGLNNMHLGMNPTMVPYPSSSSVMLPSSSMPNPATVAQMSPVPAYYPQQVPFSYPFMSQASNQYPYQQFHGVNQAQYPLPQIGR
ncbi:transcription factor [Castilleja foliolosa]|uniref:Transcription factor n=1 Tax=Castilleja foliolosa TaxID=1961234 RepID=A0ABD3DTW6_9LAMI